MRHSGIFGRSQPHGFARASRISGLAFSEHGCLSRIEPAAITAESLPVATGTTAEPQASNPDVTSRSSADPQTGASPSKFQKSAGNGQRPLFESTNSPTLAKPNGYTLELDDSQYGKLSYEAKIGLVNQ